MTSAANSPLVELESTFADILNRAQNADYTPQLEAFEKTLAEDHAGYFEEQHDSTGSPWAPLAESTVKRKGHNRILYETGALMASLVSVGGPGNIHGVSEQGRGLIFGTDIEYALFHQTGTERMPARPPVGVKDESLDNLCDRLADRTVEIIMET